LPCFKTLLIPMLAKYCKQVHRLVESAIAFL